MLCSRVDALLAQHFEIRRKRLDRHLSPLQFTLLLFPYFRRHPSRLVSWKIQVIQSPVVFLNYKPNIDLISRTILYLSILYALGNVLLSVSAIPNLLPQV